MRSFFSWVWDEVSSFFSSSLSSYLIPITLGVTGLSLCVSFYLYSSLQLERAEKEQVLAQFITLQNTISKLQRSKDADNTIAQIIINQSDILDSINTQVALEIAGIPTLEWEQNHEQAREPFNEHSTEQKRVNDETNTSTIDIPLPRLSASLIMLYNKVSRANNPTASSMAHGNISIASSTSQANDSSTDSTVGKRASHDLR